jgi:hypothetical protein
MIDRAAIEYVGWAATVVFVSSYVCARAVTVKRVQMAGAAMWIGYGVLIGAVPVVAANLLVFGAAAWSSRIAAGIRDSATEPSGATPRSLRSDQAPI